MNNLKRKFMSLVVICCFVASLVPPAYPTKAAANLLPTAADNLSVGLINGSKLVAIDNGYMRVFWHAGKINIEYYDDSFQIQSKRSLDMELDLWGGFYAGADAYYLVEGQLNTAESDTAEVIRVIQYDKNWNKTGTAKITSNQDLFIGGEVRIPFDYGCVEMTEYDGTLYIVTGHQGYVDPVYGQGHQGFLMIAVDEASMTGKIVDSDLWHSFAQYIAGKDSDLYVLEQSEGSRYTKLSKYNAENLQQKTSLPVLEYGGSRDSAWAISCYASVDGMAVSSDHVLCLGTSIDQTKYDSVTDDTAHNIYLTVTPMDNFSEDATAVEWLTDYNGGGKCFYGTKITRINNNRFMVSWEEYDTSQTASADDTLSESILHYIFVDGNGKKVSNEFTAAAPISDCQPIVKGSQIVYYASNANMVDFYSIDVETGNFNKKVYQVAGENVTWNLTGDVLTLSGSGAISIDPVTGHRPPVSSTSHVFYYSNESAWRPISEKVKKIVIGEGITGIPESAFVNFDSLTEVEVSPGVTSIGAKAFYECDILSKITIPSSVTSLGEDFLWTGYYWVGSESHVVRATIYAPKDSYAIEYAKENGIRYVMLDENNNEIGSDKDNDTDSDRDNDTDSEITTEVKNIIGAKESDRKGKYVVPKKAVISKLTSPKARQIRVTWKRDPQASGYQIQYAKNAKFKKGKKTITIAKNSTVSKKISKLTKNKKYYVRVRAYKKIDGKKRYGSWSKTKKIKCRG